MVCLLSAFFTTLCWLALAAFLGYRAGRHLRADRAAASAVVEHLVLPALGLKRESPVTNNNPEGQADANDTP